MIGQNQVNFKSAFVDFFKRAVDFGDFSGRKEHWIPVGTIYGIFTVIYGSIFISAYSEYTKYSLGGLISFTDALTLALRYNRDFSSLLYIITGVFVLLHIPIAASFCRRLRDVGFNTGGLSVAVALYFVLSYFHVELITPLYGIVFFFVLMSLPTNKLETTKNDEFSKFFFRQTIEAENYYAQFNPYNNGVRYDQFGNPINNQPNYPGNGQGQFNNGTPRPQNPTFQNNQGNNQNPAFQGGQNGQGQFNNATRRPQNPTFQNNQGNNQNPAFQGGQNGQGQFNNATRRPQNPTFQNNQGNNQNPAFQGGQGNSQRFNGEARPQNPAFQNNQPVQPQIKEEPQEEAEKSVGKKEEKNSQEQKTFSRRKRLQKLNKQEEPTLSRKRK